MKFSLVITQGTGQGKAIPITKAEFVVGRDAKCNLRPASQAVSKRHCVMRIKGEQVFVEDLKSTNGTFINDVAVAGEKEIRDGDRLKIGPLDFIVRLESAAQAEKPTHVEKETRVPGKAARTEEIASENLDDDTVGSMLLSLAEDEKAAAPDDSDSFAGGSTVMQVLKPEELEQLNNATDKAAPYRPQPNKPSSTGNTSSAAKAILEKYRRRPKA